MSWSWALSGYQHGAFRWWEVMSVATWPLLLALAGAALGLAAARGRRTPGPEWLSIPVVLPLAVWGVGAVSLADHPHRWMGYGPLAVAGLLASAIPMLVLLRRRRHVSVPRTIAAALLVFPAASQPAALALTDVPMVSVEYSPHQFEGRAQTLVASQRFASCSLPTSQVQLSGSRVGENTVDFPVDCGTFSFVHSVIVTVGSTLADARFPLTPGRSHHYEVVPTEGKVETCAIEVLATRWDDPPLSGHELRIGPRRVRAYGFEGRTWLFDRVPGPKRARTFTPLFAEVPSSPPSDANGYQPAEGDAPFLFMPMRWLCSRFTTPPGGIPGPDDCAARVDRTDPVLAGFTLLFTGGLGLPWVMKDANARAHLISSSTSEQ